jgi:hypothetical protein
MVILLTGSLAGPRIWHILVGSANNAAKRFWWLLFGVDCQKVVAEKTSFEVDWIAKNSA